MEACLLTLYGALLSTRPSLVGTGGDPADVTGGLPLYFPLPIGLSHSACLELTAYFTITVAFMCGCSAQKYWYVPRWVNVCEKVSSLLSPAELKAPVADVTVCGSSS